jgi:hypothetical protein
MTLVELQRRMLQDVSRPLTEDMWMQPAAEDGTPMTRVAESYIAPNARLTSFERLEIYNRQYWFRTIAAVSEDFPAVEQVIGGKRFEHLVLAYLRATPSTSWNLRDLSAALPDFLRSHPEFAGRRHRLAVDVARLEWAYIEAFDSERAEPLAMEAMQMVQPNSRLNLQPHLQLLEMEFPVDDLVLAIHSQRPESEMVSNAVPQRSRTDRAALPVVLRRRTYLAVHRFDNSVYYRRLEREWFQLLRAVRSGATLEEALTSAFHRSRLAPSTRAETMQHCFAVAAELGWFTA